jgi:hypothetical protein
MAQRVFEYLAGDHDRLEALLARATAVPEKTEIEAYEEFRRGLLRHISIEEKILLPAIARLQGGKPSPVAERLRSDHGALAALLVPPPSPPVIRTLLTILGLHNALEESGEGVYRRLDTLAGEAAEEIVRQMTAAPGVRTMPHNSRPEVLEATRRALARAGYRLLEDDPPALLPSE